MKDSILHFLRAPRRAALVFATLVSWCVLSSGSALGQGNFVPIAIHQVEASYGIGYDAYMRDDCVEAVRWFGIYLFLSPSAAIRDAEKEQLVNQAYSYCSTQLRNAVISKRNLDQYGDITRVTSVYTQGKADAPAVERTVPFHHAPQQYVPKVNLPMPRSH